MKWRGVSILFVAAILSVALAVALDPLAASAGAPLAAASSSSSVQGGASERYAYMASYAASVSSFGDPSVPQGVRVKRSGPRALRLRWEPVEGAKGYVVYRWSERKLKWRRAKALPADATTWRDKGRKPDVTYRYAVAACFKGGGRAAGKKSYWVEARAYSRGASEVNPGRVDPGLGEVTLRVGDVRALAAAAAPSGYGERIGSRGCRAAGGRLRLDSSDRSVIPDWDLSATMRASRVGACEVRVLAPNGNLSAPVRVTVVGHEPPGEFSVPEDDERYRLMGPEVYDPELVEYLNARSGEIHALAEDLYGGWTDHSAWSVAPAAGGPLTFPGWMGGSERARVAALFEDGRFSDEFRLREVSFDTGPGGSYFTLHFYSAALDSADPWNGEYRVSGPAEACPGTPIAAGWWLEYPEAADF